jgi:hypothetical protein
MSKLTKQEAASHEQAVELLTKDVLTFDERLFVLDHWREDATHINSVAGAFFTPSALARSLAVEVSGRKCIDLCAGIGALAFAVYYNGFRMSTAVPPEIVCVEINPDYAAVGRKVLPEATWIVADVLDLPENLTGFDCAISNPPFGRIKQPGRGPRYFGSEFEFKVVDVASDRAEYGVFLLPQNSVPFKLSGIRCFEKTMPEKYAKFTEQTQITLAPNCGIDTAICVKEDGWHGVSIVTEIAVADFDEAAEKRQPQEELQPQFDLFAA